MAKLNKMSSVFDLSIFWIPGMFNIVLISFLLGVAVNVLCVSSGRREV